MKTVYESLEMRCVGAKRAGGLVGSDVFNWDEFNKGKVFFGVLLLLVYGKLQGWGLTGNCTNNLVQFNGDISWKGSERNIERAACVMVKC